MPAKNLAYDKVLFIYNLIETQTKHEPSMK